VARDRTKWARAGCDNFLYGFKGAPQARRTSGLQPPGTLANSAPARRGVAGGGGGSWPSGSEVARGTRGHWGRQPCPLPPRLASARRGRLPPRSASPHLTIAGHPPSRSPGEARLHLPRRGPSSTRPALSCRSRDHRQGRSLRSRRSAIGAARRPWTVILSGEVGRRSGGRRRVAEPSTRDSSADSAGQFSAVNLCFMFVRCIAAASALAIVLIALSGCSSHASAPGVVAGFAARCAGPGIAALGPLKVSARQHGRAVTSDVVSYRMDRGHYRLILPPGQYVIRARGSGDPPNSVVLHSREHLTINFPNMCPGPGEDSDPRNSAPPPGR